uniref:Uncharacterized protein n=1 Tax=Pseudo-nitzschia australis TaxID=44445 RepID=A0A6V0BFH9_9STRA
MFLGLSMDSVSTLIFQGFLGFGISNKPVLLVNACSAGGFVSLLVLMLAVSGVGFALGLAWASFWFFDLFLFEVFAVGISCRFVTAVIGLGFAEAITAWMDGMWDSRRVGLLF